MTEAEMNHEILTCPLRREQLWQELAFVARYFSEREVSRCKILFGFAWGNDYYPGDEWPEEEIGLNALEAKVKAVEETGIGELGTNDLFIQFQNLEFQFCNDSDIHIRFAQHSSDIENFYGRWKELGYHPAEWIKSEKPGPGERVRCD